MAGIKLYGAPHIHQYLRKHSHVAAHDVAAWTTFLAAIMWSP